MLIQYDCIDQEEEAIKASLIDSFETRTIDLQKSRAVAEQALEKCHANHNMILHAYATAYLGYYDMIQSDHEAAKKRMEYAQEIFISKDHWHGIGFTQTTLGSIAIRLGDYHTGLKHLLESIDKFKACDNLEGQSRSIRFMGMVHQSFGDYAKAEENYRDCILLSEQINDKNGVSNACNTLSSIMLKRRQVQEAQELSEKSIALKLDTNDQRGLGFAYYGLAKVLMSKDNFEEAEKLLQKSLGIHQDSGDQIGQMMALNQLGVLLDRTGRTAQAEESFQKCVQLGETSGHNLIMQKSYYGLYLIAKKAQNFELCCEYIDLHLKYKNKVVDSDTQKMIQSLQAISRLELLEKESRWQKEVNARVERKNKELDSFIYKITHDLRGPISSMMALHDLISYEITDEKSLSYFDIYDKQIRQLNTTLTDFMSILQTKEMKLEYKKLNLKEMVDECIESFKFHEHFDKIQFNIKVKVEAYWSDKSTLKSIIQNLIENTVKYCRPDVEPVVNINIRKKDKHLHLVVEDNGIGISDADQERIFDMFFRTQNKMTGTGLGLYILKEAVEKLHGTVKLDSTLGKGSTFEIVLPIESKT